MKQIKRGGIIKGIFLVFALFIFLSIPGGQVQAKSQKYYVEKFLKYYKQEKFTKARKNYNKLKKYASEKCVKKMPKIIKKAYKKILQRYQGYDDESSNYLYSYYYTDFTNNGKAELILMLGSPHYVPKTIMVYKYKKGKAVLMGSMESSHDTLHAYPGHKGIIVINCVNAMENVDVLYYSKGKFKYKSYGTREAPDGDWFLGHGMLRNYQD